MQADEIVELSAQLAHAAHRLEDLSGGRLDAVADPTRGGMLLLPHAQNALVATETRYRRLLDRMSAVVFELNADGTTLYVNEPFEAATGFKHSDVIGKNWWSTVCPRESHTEVNQLRRRLQDGDVIGYEFAIVHRDGSLRTFELTTANQYDAAGALQRIVAFGTDITVRRQLERQRRFAQHTLENSPFATFWIRPDGHFNYVNEASEVLTRRKREELLSLDIGAMCPALSGSGWLGVWRAIQTTSFLVFDQEVMDGKGTSIPVEINISRFTYEGEEYACAVLADRTQQRSSEKAARLLEALIQSSSDAIRVVGLDGTVLTLNPAAERLLGCTAKDIVGKPVRNLVGPDLHAEVEELLHRVHSGESITNYPRTLKSNGRTVHLKMSLFPIRDASGKIIASGNIFRDVTEEKILEEKLACAQRLETVGRLAGGIAHDFNNMLCVMIGYSEFLRKELDGSPVLKGFTEEISDAGERAAALTRQLLAFSRRQMLMPVVLDLNELIGEMEKMLTRLIGEDIIPEFTYYKPLPKIKADPGQIEQVVMNLAVNARDAMPQGGRLSIRTSVRVVAPETGNSPQTFVLLTVEDTGCGMDDDTVSRMFEPFFTTKGPDKGTGLGLATVHGIIHQSGGRIDVKSTPGVGTRFDISLPATEEAVRVQDAVIHPIREGAETILLVEDEPKVRLLTARSLQSLGYQVLQAASGRQALTTVREHSGPIHLVLSDVIMGEMSGLQLAREVSRMNPEVRVLLMSGYTHDALSRYGVNEVDVPLLAKPFDLSQLSTKVREVLDNRSADRAWCA